MMLYGSWKYLTTKRKVFLHQDTQRNLIDLLVFHDLQVEEHLPVDCQIFRYFGNETHPNSIETPLNDQELKKSFEETNGGSDEKEKSTNKDEIVFDSACWRIPQIAKTNEDLEQMSAYDNFLLYFRDGIEHVLMEYSHVLHVNLDTVLTPNLLMTNLNSVILKVGVTLNCDENRKIEIQRFSEMVGLGFDRNKPCASYSVFGRTNIIIKLLQKVYKVGNYLSLEKARSHDEALLIAKDLLLQTKTFDFESVFTFIDSSTCSSMLSIYKVLTITVADDVHCVFNKVTFFNMLTNLQTLSPKEKKDFRKHATKDLTRANAEKINIAEFSKFISYKYAARSFV